MGYYLQATDIDNPSTGTTFYEATQALLPLLNEIGRLHSPRFRRVTLDGRYQDGDKRHAVIAVGAVEARARVTAVATVLSSDGKVAPQPVPLSATYINLAQSHPDVAEILRLLASANTGWVEPYKVFEVVRDATTPVRIDQSGMAAKDAISAFSASANRPDVSGAGARHARIYGGYPKQTMTLDEGRRFINTLVHAWLNTPDITVKSGLTRLTNIQVRCAGLAATKLDHLRDGRRAGCGR